MKHSLPVLSILAVFALTACTQSAPPSSVVKPAAKVDPANAVNAIRAAGVGLDSAVQVHPLRDPAIDGFLKKANEAETRNEFAAAIESANKALKLAPDAPEILQTLAELETARGNWQQADQWAMKSFDLGPKIGSLCARNWQTVVEARTALGDAASAAQAAVRVKDCRVPPRLRM
jgi:tetratricopeptide (TPR) repeat protein